MTFNLKTFEECLAKEVGERKARTFMSRFGPEPSGGAVKSSYYKALMDALSKEFPDYVGERALMCHGRRCLGKTVAERARKLFQQSKDLEEFVGKLNAEGLAGGRLMYSEGKITGYYDRCYCGAVSKTSEPFGPTYCNCSRGWLLELFEAAIGRKCDVRFHQTVIQGGRQCDFEITLK